MSREAKITALKSLDGGNPQKFSSPEMFYTTSKESLLYAFIVLKQNRFANFEREILVNSFQSTVPDEKSHCVVFLNT